MRVNHCLCLKVLPPAWLETQVGVGGVQLSLGQAQLVGLARACFDDPALIVLDEPTSSLSDEDKNALSRVIRKLRSEGIAVVYISHFLDEINEIFAV